LLLFLFLRSEADILHAHTTRDLLLKFFMPHEPETFNHQQDAAQTAEIWLKRQPHLIGIKWWCVPLHTPILQGKRDLYTPFCKVCVPERIFFVCVASDVCGLEFFA
jgi:hypothetical protein